MSWKARFYAGLGEWLRSRGVPVIEVINVEERWNSTGIRTRLSYKNRFGEHDFHDYAGPLSDIINGIS